MDGPVAPPAVSAASTGTGVVSRLLGVALFLLSLAVFSATVLRAPLEGGSRLGLDPRPDAEQYFAGAVSLYRTGSFTVEVGGHALPPRYPFGYSLLMMPWLAAGVTPIHVPFLVNDAVGIGLLCGIFLALWRGGHPTAAGLAAALVACWPSFVILCRSPLSEPSGAAVLLLACWRFRAFVASRRLRTGAFAGVLLGVSVWFRIANVFFLPLTLLAALALKSDLRGRAKGLLAGGLGAAAGMAPLLIYQHRHFGSPLRTGYSLWVPYWADTHNAFRLEWVAANARYWWADLTGANHPYTVANMFGNGSYLTPGLIALIAFIAVTRLRRRADLPVAASLAASVVCLLFYFFQDGRLLFPALLVCVPFAARESVALLTSWRSRGAASMAGALLTVLLIASALTGAPRSRGGTELRDLLRLDAMSGTNPRYALVLALNRVAGSEPATILTDFSPWYISSLAEADHLVLPVKLEHQPDVEPRIVTDADRVAAIAAALADHRPVYLMNAEPPDPDRPDLLAPPAGYAWATIISPAGSARLARLIAAGPGAAPTPERP